MDICPPKLDETDDRNPVNMKQYKAVDPALLPASESIKDICDRVVPYYETRIAVDLLDNKDVLVVAHGNSLRALIARIEGLSEEKMIELDIPTAVPLVYELDEELKPVSVKVLGDKAVIRARQEKAADILGKG